MSDPDQVDAVVYSINPQGFFAQAGPLRLFVSAHVRFNFPGNPEWPIVGEVLILNHVVSRS